MSMCPWGLLWLWRIPTPFLTSGSTAVNEATLAEANRSGRLFMVHSLLGSTYILRFAIGTPSTTEAHILESWTIIQDAAAVALSAPPAEASASAAH